MKHCFLFVVFSLLLLSLSAVQFSSVTSGDWFDPATWGMSDDIPDYNDDVQINSGHTVELVGASSVYINSLTLLTYENPAILRGPYAMSCQLFIAGTILMETSTSSTSLIPGDYGQLSVEVGGDVIMRGMLTYIVSRTTFTALAPGIEFRRAQLGVYGSGQIQTIFDTSEPAVTLEIITSISFPGGVDYGFENTRLDLWPDVGFVNCKFVNCDFFVRNNTSVNTLNYCHLYSCHASETMYFTGAVAMMDNGNTFDNLTILSGGSLWGNYGTGSSVSITNNLRTYSGSLVSAGDYGTLVVYLGGNLNVDGQFFPTELYFIGARTEVNPQEMFQGPNADIICTTTNSGSVLRLASDIDFNPLLSYFYPGQLYLNGHSLAHAVVTSGYIHDSGTLRDCYVNSTTFYNHLTMYRCNISDSGTVFEGNLTLTGGLYGAYGSEIDLTIQGNLSVTHGSILPGDYGILNIHLLGNLDLTEEPGSTISFAPSNVYLEGMVLTQYINTHGITFYSNLIAVNPLQVSFASNITFTPGLDKHVVSATGTRTRFLLNGNVLRNAVLDGGDYLGGTLSYVNLYGVHGTDLTLFGDVLVGDNDIVFNGQTTNHAWLRGAYGAETTLTFMGNINNYNFVIPGEYGTLDAYCYGNVSDDTMYPNTWRGTLHLRGTGDRQYSFSETIPVVIDESANLSLYGDNILPTFSIGSESTLTILSGASLAISDLGGFYSGNMVMNGAFANYRNLEYTDLIYHDLIFHPIILDGAGGTLSVQHKASAPAHLANSTGEYWNLSRIGAYSSVNGGIDLHYRGEVTENLRVFYSIDDGETWALFSGEVYNNPTDKIITIVSMEISPYTLIAISSVYDLWVNGSFTPDSTSPVSLRPFFDWPDLNGATAYRIEISNDDWQSVCYYGSVVAVSEYTAEWALAPGTAYRWKVYVTSPYLGDLFSRDTYRFITRPAMTCSLPTNAAYLPGDSISYYMPAYLQNLMLGEPFVITPYSSAHLQASYADGTLSVIPSPGWTGSESIELQIADDYTVLNPIMHIVILGDPSALQIEVTFFDGNYFDDLSWSAVPGATYYAVYSSESPDGPWSYVAWAVDNRISLSQSTSSRFYRVTAHTGDLPRNLR